MPGVGTRECESVREGPLFGPPTSVQNVERVFSDRVDGSLVGTWLRGCSQLRLGLVLTIAASSLSCRLRSCIFDRARAEVEGGDGGHKRSHQRHHLAIGLYCRLAPAERCVRTWR